MKQFTDQMGNTIVLEDKPKRIISIVPSQTELLYDLGLAEQLVGITKFCIHPDKIFRSKARVGGTKTLHIDKIEALQPDLIIGNKEENKEEQIKEIMQKYPVWMSDIQNLDEALDMIEKVGEITVKQAAAQSIIEKITTAFNTLTPARQHRKTCAYFIWKNPYMCAGKDTFINQMLYRCGWINIFEQENGRYPEITPDMLVEKQPGLILLSSEPYPFKKKHVEEFKTICPEAKILIVDGELFSWYGSRLQYAPSYFKSILDSI